MAAKKPKKKQSIRNNEYYDTQECFDKLYQGSQQGKRFTKLMELITSEENIMLAYRSIKKNKGRTNSGCNTPCSRMESASSLSASSLNTLRGCSRFGSI